MDHAQLVLPHSSIGMSPFELQKGYPPRTLFNWHNPSTDPVNAQEQLSQEEAQAVARHLEETVELGRKNIEAAQQKKERDVNRYRQPINF